MPHSAGLIGTATAQLSLTLLITVAAMGCDQRRSPLMSRSTSTPTTPTPIPTPTAPVADGSIFGVISERTPTGSKPVAGAFLQHLSCGLANCPAIIEREVITDKDGAFRIPDVYNGTLNFLWVFKDGYRAAEPNEPYGSCDGCNRRVSVNGDTRLDIEVVRE